MALCQLGEEGEEGADQTGDDREGKARSEETGEEFQDTIGEAGGDRSFKYFPHTEAQAFD